MSTRTEEERRAAKARYEEAQRQEAKRYLDEAERRERLKAADKAIERLTKKIEKQKRQQRLSPEEIHRRNEAHRKQWEYEARVRKNEEAAKKAEFKHRAQKQMDLRKMMKAEGYSEARVRGIMKGIEVDHIVNKTEGPFYYAAKARFNKLNPPGMGEARIRKRRMKKVVNNEVLAYQIARERLKRQKAQK